MDSQSPVPEIHGWGPPEPKTAKPQYEAMPMIGYDNLSERYVVHWIVFGGRFLGNARVEVVPSSS